jgi:hypothetical protein
MADGFEINRKMIEDDYEPTKQEDKRRIEAFKLFNEWFNHLWW